MVPEGIVGDDRNVGSNYKVGDLTNMYRWAKHDIIVVSDSDIRVGRTYLRNIAGPFQDLEVGAVTCLYTGSSVGGVTSAVLPENSSRLDSFDSSI